MLAITTGVVRLTQECGVTSCLWRSGSGISSLPPFWQIKKGKKKTPTFRNLSNVLYDDRYRSVVKSAECDNGPRGRGWRVEEYIFLYVKKF
ncbi:hypothetical protein GDO78_010200 [Eleutherodactylus coqui]|uniref:Uncharacterized protein n=1 Tax=Eleutherodactylus coqui TaxID=57060 RepID=A0A8J6F3F5_ELECQ|nr:hypothetical protein GDO78_010200 [Eleutherodactylus coqui]